MNYVELHLGDWAKAVAHLSPAEEGVYLRLLRRYYADEAPLPADLAACQRLAGARTPDEREAVVAVLAEFFVASADGHHNKRADEEIAKYREGEPEREAKRANERERQRRAREERCRLFEELRLRGVVPAYSATTTELRRLLSQHVTRDIQSTNDVRPRDDTATQTPDTNTQKKEQKRKGDRFASPGLPEWLHPEVWADWHDYRNGRKGWTARARTLSLATLTMLHEHGHDPQAVVNQSIERGWTGLFPVRNDLAPPGRGPPQSGNSPSRQVQALSAILGAHHETNPSSRVVLDLDPRRPGADLHPEPRRLPIGGDGGGHDRDVGG